MSLTPIEKINLLKYIKSNPMGELYFGDMKEAIARRKGQVSFVEVIEYCTDYILESFTGKNTFNVKLCCKCASCVETLITWCDEDNINVDELLIGKIRMLKSEYETYKASNPVEDDEKLVNLFNSIEAFFNEVYPVNNEQEAISYVKEISRLQEEIKILKKELDEQSRTCDLAEKRLKEKERDLKKKQEETSKAKNEEARQKAIADRLDKEIIRMRSKIEELESKVSELQGLVDNLNSSNENLGSLKISLEGEVRALRELLTQKESLLKAKEKVIAAYADSERRASIKEQEEADKAHLDEQIRENIFTQLINGGCTSEELVAGLSKDGFQIELTDVYRHITDLRRIVNISTPSFNTSPNYVIVPPQIVRNGTFDITIPEGCKSYDILLTSDYHISTLEKQTISDFDAILEYCTLNNIKLVINAGDFYCFRFPNKANLLKRVTNAQKIVERTISKLPSCPGIYHAIMGGNHDKDALRYGFDPLATLTNAREDYLHLGYDHVTITFNGERSLLTSFMVHHINNRFPDPVMQDEYSNEFLIQSLESYYSNLDCSRDDSYIDVLGHFHKSGLDTINSICTAPSFRRDRFNNGAWHLKVYFDDKTNIKYMVFKPLELNGKLVATTEIAYQKLLLK